MAHQADDLEGRRWQLREPPASHARVEFQVHAHARRYLVGRDDELERGVARLATSRLLPAGPMTTIRAVENSLRSVEPFGNGRDAQRGRACAERRACDIRCAVTVAVRLHDRPQLRACECAQERSRVAAQSGEVDGQLGTVHLCEHARQRVDQVARDKSGALRRLDGRALLRDRRSGGGELRLHAFREERGDDSREDVSGARRRE